MKSFLRENPTIAFGLGLPLLLVVVFLLISGIPALLVGPPQHDVLYATEYYNYQNGVQISVVGQKVQVIYQGVEQANRKPRIWRYNPKTGAVKEILVEVAIDVRSDAYCGRINFNRIDGPGACTQGEPDIETASGANDEAIFVVLVEQEWESVIEQVLNVWIERDRLVRWVVF